MDVGFCGVFQDDLGLGLGLEMEGRSTFFFHPQAGKQRGKQEKNADANTFVERGKQSEEAV